MGLASEDIKGDREHMEGSMQVESTTAERRMESTDEGELNFFTKMAAGMRQEQLLMARQEGELLIRSKRGYQVELVGV